MAKSEYIPIFNMNHFKCHPEYAIAYIQLLAIDGRLNQMKFYRKLFRLISQNLSFTPYSMNKFHFTFISKWNMTNRIGIIIGWKRWRNCSRLGCQGYIVWLWALPFLPLDMLNNRICHIVCENDWNETEVVSVFESVGIYGLST